ncbi:unnamed protein product, partial [Mesorhabditis spiculigera]
MKLFVALFGLFAIIQKVTAFDCPLFSFPVDPTRNRTADTPDVTTSPPSCPTGQFCYSDGTSNACYYPIHCPRLPANPNPRITVANTTSDPPSCGSYHFECYYNGISDDCYEAYSSTDRPTTRAPVNNCQIVHWPMTPASIMAEADPSTGACTPNTHCEEGRTTIGQHGRFCIADGYVDPNRLTVPWYFV